MQIGRLVQLNIRDVWATEPGQFTPWLALQENLELLASSLGLGELRKAETEVSVGSFRADIVCFDETENIVLIENQYGRSDHQHLGQTLTYLVGREARTIVWIAETLKEEHRAVIDWLNEVTPLDYAFFGVEIEVWRIGDSLPAPKFEVVVQPNNWERQEKAKVRQTRAVDSQGLTDYWEALLNSLPELEGLKRPKRPPRQGWLKLSFDHEQRVPGNAGLYVYRLVHRGRIGTYISLGVKDQDAFEAWLPEIEAKNYPSLAGGVWEPTPGGNFAYFITFDCDPTDRDDWRRQHDWAAGRMGAFLNDWKGGLRSDTLRLIGEFDD